jgi:hypothetical protein
MSKRQWEIVGYDSATEVFRTALPEGSLSTTEMRTLLQRLASRHLSENEVVMASLRKNASEYAPFLEIQQAHGTSVFTLTTTGSGHHYIASIRDIE